MIPRVLQKLVFAQVQSGSTLYLQKVTKLIFLYHLKAINSIAQPTINLNTHDIYTKTH